MPAEERKVVTVLFCEVLGLGTAADAADPEDAKAALRPYHARIRREIERFGGVVDKYMGEGLLGVFGMPAAHEDDPERAVQAALRIRRAIGRRGDAGAGTEPTARIGIDTGEAVVSFGRGPQVGERVTGDIVNTASRLQTSAPPGDILVGEATYRATLSRIEYEVLAPITVKGKHEPLAVWRPVAARSRFGVGVGERETISPFIGRAVELGMLQGIFRRTVQERSVQLVTITGEPGIGKSRLVSELFQFADDLPEVFVWRQGRCLPYGEGVTFWALGEIVKSHAGILDSDGPAEAAGKLEVSVGAVTEDPDEADWLVARLASLVGTTGDEQQSSGDRAESFTAWRRLFEAIAVRHPLVLVFEDLHWADEPMLDFLEHLVDWATSVPILIVCAGRPELFERRPEWGGGKRNSTTIALGPLTQVETGLLIAALLSSAVLPPATQQVLLERCGGNPLYAEEFVRMLTDRGIIDPTARRVTLSPDVDIPVPDTVQALIAARLDTLPRERKELLHDAAVVGTVFWAGAVGSMAGLEEEDVRAELHELVRKELVRPVRTSSVEDQSEYSFWHLLVRDVAYGQIPRAARGEKHRAAAEWLERIAGDRVADHAELLAHHYREALELARAAGAAGPEDETELSYRAAHFLVLAGDRAMRLDVARAEGHYRAALALLPEADALRARARAKVAEAQFAAGRPADALADYEEAIEEFRSAGDMVGLGLTLATSARALHRLGETSASRDRMRDAVAILEKEPPGPELARTYAFAAGVSLIAGDNEISLHRAEQALDLAARLHLGATAVRARQFRGAARCELGDAAGVEDLREAVRQGIELGFGEETALAYGNLGYQLWLREGPAASLEAWRRSIAFCQVRGFHLQRMWARAGELEVLFDLGEWADVVAIARELADWDRAAGGSQLRAFAMTYWAGALVRRGEAAAANDLVDEFLPMSEKMDYVEFFAPALCVAALTASALDAPALAAARADAFGEITRAHPSFRAHYLPDLVRVLLATGDADRAAGLLIDASLVAARRDELCLRTAECLVAEARGDLARADGGFAVLAGEWGEYGHALERAHALLGRARCLRGLGRLEEAEPVAREAASAFAALHLRAEAGRATALLTGASAAVP